MYNNKERVLLLKGTTRLLNFYTRKFLEPVRPITQIKKEKKNSDLAGRLPFRAGFLMYSFTFYVKFQNYDSEQAW